MIVRHLHTVHALLSVLAQPTPEMQTLRALLTVDGRFPDTPYLGATLARHPGEPAGADSVSGPSAGGRDPAVGDVRAGGRHRQHALARPRRGLA